ncbi:MAG: zinc ribbon domain-containing protein [Oscillospiraceae bacterium]|nr:zinc ribbon domain-containing protein [Oscillospiraceae bacterium]
MICPNCGKEYNEKMTCCISCGADLVPFEKATEQTSIEILSHENEIEPIIPEMLHEPEPVSQNTGFVRKLESKAEEITIPVKHYSGSALSGAAKFTGSLITSVLMLALIIAAVAAAAFRFVTDKDNISEFAYTLDIMALPASNELIAQNSSFSSDATVQDAIYTLSLGTGLTRDDIRTIYEESTMKKFLAARLTEYADFIRNGNVPEKLTSEQLKTVFSENISLIDNTMGHSLNQHDINLAYSEIERTEPLLEIISPENMEYTIGDNTLAAMRLFGSVPAIVVASSLAASMLIVLRAINKKSTRVLTWGGGTILTGGAAVLAVTFLFSLQLPYADSDRFAKTILKCTCDVISPDLYKIGGLLAAAGVVMLIWAESLRRNTKQ